MWREQRRLSSASAGGQWSPTSEWVRVGQMVQGAGVGLGLLALGTAQERLGWEWVQIQALARVRLGVSPVS